MSENFGVLNKITGCKNCLYHNDCWKQRLCDGFKPVDPDKYCEDITKYLHKHIKPSYEKKLTRYVFQMSNWGICADGNSTDQYYVELINDNLKLIRKGKPAYCFNIDQVIEMYRFEPALRVLQYDSGIYYITK